MDIVEEDWRPDLLDWSAEGGHAESVDEQDLTYLMSELNGSDESDGPAEVGHPEPGPQHLQDLFEALVERACSDPGEAVEVMQHLISLAYLISSLQLFKACERTMYRR